MREQTITTYVHAVESEVLFARSNRARRLSITIKPDASIRVAIPRGVSHRTAEQFLAARAPWVKRHLRRIASAPPRPAPAPMQPLDRIHAAHQLSRRLDELAALHGFRFNRLTIRRQKTRWGSCSARNNISLNARLINLPPDLIDYVLLHELVHTRVKNHSRAFWTELEKVLPNAREKQRQLRQHHCAG